LIAVETGGSLRHDQFQYRADDVLVFGQETAGLSREILTDIPLMQRVTLPMMPGNRSLNLSNTVAVAVYEAWRQMAFEGGAIR
jgi:tRNA (cytidine/uridine-2'-O-)-methyltransferase